jgi:hypothetical protein
MLAELTLIVSILSGQPSFRIQFGAAMAQLELHQTFGTHTTKRLSGAYFLSTTHVD